MRRVMIAACALPLLFAAVSPALAQAKIECRTSALNANINQPRVTISMDVVQGTVCGRSITSQGGGGMSDMRVVSPARAGLVQVAPTAFAYAARPGYAGGDSFTLAWTREAGGPQVMMFEVVMTVRVNVWPSAEAMARGGPPPGLALPARPPGEAAPPGQAEAPGAPGRPNRPPSASGSGFFINRAGQVLTNDHVIRTCREITVSQRLDRRFPATVVARDQRNDLAVLSSTLPAEQWARFESDAPRAGESAVVVGYPLRGLLAFQPNVTTGNISALAGIGGDARHLQITAPVQPGNSGGPVLNARGGVVGVVVGMVNAVVLAQRAGIIPQNVNFAINNTITRQFLTANQVQFDAVEDNATARAAADIGDLAGRFTVSVECYR